MLTKHLLQFNKILIKESPIYLDPKDVPEFLRHVDGYTGQKFSASVTSKIDIPITANRWDGGSRDSYFGVQLSTQRVAPLEPNSQLTLDKDHMVVIHTISRGKDVGLEFITHPDAVNNLKVTNDTNDLSPLEMIVLNAIGGFTSAGRVREYEEYRISKDEVATTVQSLASKGYVAKAGAGFSVTIKGKNWRSSHRNEVPSAEEYIKAAANEAKSFPDNEQVNIDVSYIGTTPVRLSTGVFNLLIFSYNGKFVGTLKKKDEVPEQITHITGIATGSVANYDGKKVQIIKRPKAE